MGWPGVQDDMGCEEASGAAANDVVPDDCRFVLTVEALTFLSRSRSRQAEDGEGEEEGRRRMRCGGKLHAFAETDRRIYNQKL